ncbi:hypothetical protein EYA84_02900 [Verrucosispora sp. SN26_14.1]|uniref:hypothetical protein n=1 Tax=Verrucosispora sp. SN26_14.1 TaxID=2527879 RepID=UPI0010345411|nr:hypothetical protein [Verrucosispora sp. SN26_14.1]TBL43251.1 hypothetical protein EYA84_02900 [Verrucosispora sp. SN26_14.1]
MGEQPQASVPGSGQPHEPRLGTGHRDRPGAGGGEPARVEPDVLLDVPRVSVDSLRLSVDGLEADLSLRARVAGLLEVDAGARIRLEGVDLDVTGVQAQALLKVRLEKLVTILDRALTTIDHHPQVIDASRRSRDARDEHPGPPPTRPTDSSLGGYATDRTGGSPAGRGAGREGQAVGRTADGVGEVPEPGIGPPGGATDDLGQQVGAIGAVAGRARGDAGAGPDRTRPRDIQRDGQRERSQDGPRHTPPGGAGTEPGAGTTEPNGPEPSAARQLAEQTGESILQAGRSVWDAIQSGLAQRRQDG